VLKVQANRGQAHKVVKVSSSDRVIREANNYQRYIHDRLPGQFHTRLETTSTFWDVGASVYNFLGDDETEKLSTFRNFYMAENDIDRLLAPIAFWQTLWERTYPLRSDVSQPIYKQYDRLLDLRKNLGRLNPHSVESPLSIGLHNPLTRCYEKDALQPTGCGLRRMVHGDFHADNLFTDGEHLWLVDFERTSPGPVYADYCELEIDVLTRLLPTKIAHETFLRMAQHLMDFDATEMPSDCDSEVRKAINFVYGLRALAFQTTGEPYTLDYQWGLLCDALFVAGMRPPPHPTQEQAIQRQRAWLYASLICTHLDAVRVSEAVHS